MRVALWVIAVCLALIAGHLAWQQWGVWQRYAEVKLPLMHARNGCAEARETIAGRMGQLGVGACEELARLERYVWR